jgi:serine/threonine protein kinase/tetratricopeptide (TPR) repeat protein
MTAHERPLAPGGLLGGRYEIVRELGRGGMGIVYACVDRVTGARVALKRVERPGRATGETFWFHQEARALASLEHPAIVRARDFGVLDDGSPYLVMDLIPGRSLHLALEGGALGWSETWSLVDQVLGALSHAHARGVIHGDLKPQNLIIQYVGVGEPRVHVLDFGLAFLLRDRHDPRLDGAPAAAVAMPSGGGTPGFMAPEQIRRAVPHVGPPTDLYALGCILWQMLTGRPPYMAVKDGPDGKLTNDEDELLRLHKKAPVPVPALPAHVPPEVSGIVVRLLAKRPWRRYDYAADVRREWERVRPIGPVREQRRGVDTSSAGVPTTAPDTRVDVLSIAPPPAEPIAPPTRAPELLGLRPTPIVGRNHERGELQRLAELVAAGDAHARFGLLVGEAGVGKSRIVEWLCERMHEGGKLVPLRARYRRFNGPQDGLNGAVLAHYGLERVDRILVEQALINVWEVEKDDDEGMTWVAATAEWLRPSAYEDSSGGPPSGGPPSKERRRRERAPVGPTGKRFTLDEPELRWLVIRRVLERIGRSRPLLLWLDDFHLAPPSTIEGLLKIRRESPNLRWLLVATARFEATTTDSEVERRLDLIRRTFGGPRFLVGPLEATDTHALLRAALPLDERALNEATERSKGNPLFALQLLHAWAAKGGLELAGGAYRVREEALQGRATTTAELWDDRLRALDPRHVTSAEAAAALGVEFRGDVLRGLVGKVVGLGGFGVEVTRAIDALQRAQILIATAEDRFRFPHALLQEHLLLRLAARSDAGDIFRAAAAALGSHPLAGTRRVVRHRVLNLLRAGDADEGAELLLDYVETAWSRVRDASRTLEDLALLDVRPLDVAAARVDDDPSQAGRPTVISLSPLAPPQPSAGWAARHQRWRAEALRHAGRFEEAREAVQKARRTFASLGDELQEAHALRLLGHIDSEQGAAIEGRQMVARALTVFDRRDDDAGRASCEVVVGEIDYLLGEYVSARDALHRGARRFRALADPLGRAQCLLLLGMVELAEGNFGKSRELLSEARGEFDAIGYRLGLSQVDVALAHAEHRGGDLEAARARTLSTRDALRALENPRGLAACERLLAMIEIDREDAALAEKHARAALDVFEKLGDPWGIVESRLLLAQTALLRGELETAEEELGACDAIETTEAEPQQHRQLVRAWLSAAQGEWVRAAEAIVAAQKVFADPRRMGDHAAQLLSRFDASGWHAPARTAVREWYDAVLGVRGTGAFPLASSAKTPAAPPVASSGAMPVAQKFESLEGGESEPAPASIESVSAEPIDEGSSG